MNFIETLFGISPDGGNGVTEFLLVLCVVAVLLAAGVAWRRGLRRS